MLSILALCWFANVMAEDYVPNPDEILFKLLPDEKAQSIFKSWKGIKRNARDKAENKQIPSFTLYVNFEFGSDELTTDGEFMLSQVGLALIDSKLRKYTFFIGGHTDSVGSDEFNLILSQRRAERVKKYLMQNFNIKSDRLTAFGYGEAVLLNEAEPEADANRRVEIKNIGPKE